MLKFLLIFFIVIYLVGYLGRLFLARWVRNVTGQNTKNHYQKQKPEGEVTINKGNSKSQKNQFNNGEYVDYEEIND